MAAPFSSRKRMAFVRLFAAAQNSSDWLAYFVCVS